MRSRQALMVVLVLSFAGGAAAQQWKQWVPKLPETPRSVQSDAARQLMPVPLELAPSSEPGAPRTLRVRVWAAADFRRQTREWQARFRRLLERVNAACARWPAVRFELVDVRNWDGESAERPMAALVDELERRDAGEDVDLVVGLVAAMPVFPGSIDNLGMARLLSRHMVIRSLHDLAEHDALVRYFDTLSDGEREVVLAARKLHKEQIIFLHEWAHTLGIIHARRPAAVMNPGYDAAQSGFDATEAQLIDLALRHRAQDGAGWREATMRELRARVESAPDPNWDARDRQELLAVVTPATRMPPTPRPATPTTATPVPATRLPTATPPPAMPTTSPTTTATLPAEAPLGDADRALVARARAAALAGRQDEAWRTLAPLEAHHPRSAEVKLATCELAWRHPSGAARVSLAQVACAAAQRLAPSDPRPPLYLADLYVESGDAPRARPQLAQAQALLDRAPNDADAWGLLAVTLQKARMPTLAERAAAHAAGDVRGAVAHWAAALRKRMALPADGAALDATDEADYIAAVEAARAGLGTPAEVERIADLARRFAQLPGGDRLRCEAALRARRLEVARPSCGRFVTTAPPASLAQIRAAYVSAFGP